MLVRFRRSRRLLLAIALLGRFTTLPAPAQATSTPSPTPDLGTPTAVSAVVADTDTLRGLDGSPITSLSDAELVTFIEDTIDADQTDLSEVGSELKSSGDSIYARAEAAFEKVDDRMKALETEQEASSAKQAPGRADSLSADIDALKPEHDLLRQLYDLAIKRQRLLAQSDRILRARIADATAHLKVIFNDPSTPVTAPIPAPSATPQATPAQQPAAPPLAISLSAAATPPPPTPTPTPDPLSTLRDPELQSALSRVARQQRILGASEQRLSWVEQRLDLVTRSEDITTDFVKLEQQLIQVGGQLADFYREPAGDRPRVLTDGAARFEDFIKLARKKLAASKERLTALHEEHRVVAEALKTRRSDLEIAAKKLKAAQHAEQRLASPFALRNVRRWFYDHSANLGTIIIGTLLLLVVARWVGSRIVHAVARHGSRGSHEEREWRANTLVSAFRHFATLSILAAGGLLLLDECGVPIGPLLGGAAVIGLAIAFGAQNLIKDFFQGFMILLENQYKLNDVVRIGDKSGVVESITLRMTVLRGLDGTLHFIPNGQIDVVSNLTHGWSRALFEVGVAYKEDVDQVMRVIQDLGREIRADEKFSPLIRSDLEMLGVDDFADSAVVIKFYIQTVPLKQWRVRREMLRRIKHRFDQLGIEIPFPHQTTFHRFDEEIPLPGSAAERFQ